MELFIRLMQGAEQLQEESLKLKRLNINTSNTDMKVLVIVVTYNALQWIDKCLVSLLNSTIPVDCIVIDNMSTDDTVKYIKESYQWVHLVVSEKNLGFGQGNNIGLQYAIDNNCTAETYKD